MKKYLGKRIEIVRGAQVGEKGKAIGWHKDVTTGRAGVIKVQLDNGRIFDVRQPGIFKTIDE